MLLKMGRAAQRQQRLQTETLVRTRGNFERTTLMIGGALLFTAGLFLWCGNVFGFYPTFSGAGYIAIVVGGTIYNIANND